jgi:thermitase
MKLLNILIMMLVALVLFYAGVSSAQEKMTRIIVQFEDNVEAQEIKDIIKLYGGVLQNYENKQALKELGQIYELKIEDKNKAKIIDSYRKDKRVKFAEEDQLVPGSYIPNDPKLLEQWYIPSLKIDAIWENYTGKNIIVAVLDTGVDGTHPDLKDNIIPGWNVLLNNNITRDTNKHGTWVAGVISAVANNKIGIAGVAHSVKIMPIVIANENAYASWSNIATGLVKASDMGADIANISYMAYSSSLVNTAAKYFVEKGGIVFVSSGNEGVAKTAKPSDYTIVVGATGKTNNRMSWSNYGPMMDVMAPGDSIVTTRIGGTYSTTWGTSIASPICAAVMALMLEANNQKINKLTVAELNTALFATAIDLGVTGKDDYTGNGLVNPLAAINYVKNK